MKTVNIVWCNRFTRSISEGKFYVEHLFWICCLCDHILTFFIIIVIGLKSVDDRWMLSLTETTYTTKHSTDVYSISNRDVFTLHFQYSNIFLPLFCRLLWYVAHCVYVGPTTKSVTISDIRGIKRTQGPHLYSFDVPSTHVFSKEPNNLQFPTESMISMEIDFFLLYFIDT